MSTRNQSPDNSQPIHTATVAIFTPDMKRTLLVYNDRLIAFVPPGGKQEKIDGGEIICTAFREVKEEVGIDLKHTRGEWLDIGGKSIIAPEIVQTETFDLEDKRFLDHLFFYRLQDEYQMKYSAEKIGEWYANNTLQPQTIIYAGRPCRMMIRGTREAVLRVMR